MKFGFAPKKIKKKTIIGFTQGVMSIESKAHKHNNLGKDAVLDKVFDFVLKFLY